MTARLLPVLVLLAAAFGCGYTADPLIRTDIQTVCVPVFDNKTFRRHLEVAMTRNVVDEINMRTPLTVVPRDHADSVLIGTIRDFKQTVLTKTPEDNILEMQYTVYVSVKWIDLRSGRVLMKYDDVRATADQVYPTESFDQATERSFQNAARKIVSLMQSPW